MSSAINKTATRGSGILSRSPAGFSLVELMIALLLGLFLMLVLIQFFLGNRQTYVVNEGLARLQETGRFGIEAIKREVRETGAHGFCVGGRELPIRNHLNTCPGLYDGIFDADRPIGGLEYIGTAPGQSFVIPNDADPAGATTNQWSSTSMTMSQLPSQLSGRVMPFSDVLVVRSPEVLPGVTAVGNTQVNSAALNLTAAHGVAQNSIVLITNCATGADLFQNVNAPTATSFSRGNAPSCAPSGPGNRSLDWSTQYGGSLQAFRMRSTAFFVGRNTLTGQPGLYRLVFSNGSQDFQEIVDGVESMQILYGYSRPGSQSTGQGVTDWLTADQVPDWSLVIAVRIALLARSADRVPGFEQSDGFVLLGTNAEAGGDGIMRRVFTTTITLRNRMVVL